MRLFRQLKPHIVLALSDAVSKIHVSFDGWTTKGGKRGFFGIVAHFPTAAGAVHDLPVSLPQLAGAHTGEAIAAVVVQTLREFGITSNQLGYFVLDNASNNDTAIAAIARDYGGFDPIHCRLRCGPHTINLIGQALLSDDDKDSYNNAAEELRTQELYMHEWRRHGQLGTLIAVINYIRTPQQHELFRACQRDANKALPADDQIPLLTPNCLKPLQIATKRLEDRGKASSFGAIYEVLPVFEYLLRNLEELAQPWIDVDFNAHNEAPEDHLHINLRAAWKKADAYYNKLDDSPIYYAATCLHPLYKYYCENSWSEKPEWIEAANKGFQRLWKSYKKLPKPVPILAARSTRTSDIDDVIEAYTQRNHTAAAPQGDEYDRWLNQEPPWRSLDDGNVIQYWIAMRSRYSCLSQFAIDILTIPASSCECERLFSELGDLLEPERRAISSELLAALQLIRAWTRAGYNTKKTDGIDGSTSLDSLTDESLSREYDIYSWAELLETEPVEK
ncbi:hypothetical protein AA0121_g12589 [Alternaria tenuissima]|nr:hypothetical protein AA0121_g12589 [Alternaria tenuissima]